MGAGRTTPAIIVSWIQSDELYANRSATRAQHFEDTEANHRALANQTGAELIRVAQVWEDVRSEELPFSLYKDGNHPSLEGSYLAALVIYAALSHSDGNEVSYVPWGMSSEHAALLRGLARKSIRARGSTG